MIIEFCPDWVTPARSSMSRSTVYNYIHVGNARSTVAFTHHSLFEAIVTKHLRSGITTDDGRLHPWKRTAALRVVSILNAVERDRCLGKPRPRHPRVVEFMARHHPLAEDLIKKVRFLREKVKGMFISVWKIPQRSSIIKPWRFKETARKWKLVISPPMELSKSGEISWGPWDPVVRAGYRVP